MGVAEHEGARYLTVNGLIVAQARRHDLWDLVTKAHLPMLLHPNPRRVALVGLGAGVSLGATASHDLERLVCVELSPGLRSRCGASNRVVHSRQTPPEMQKSSRPAPTVLLSARHRGCSSLLQGGVACPDGEEFELPQTPISSPDSHGGSMQLDLDGKTALVTGVA